jgi:hypothetical protein
VGYAPKKTSRVASKLEFSTLEGLELPMRLFDRGADQTSAVLERGASCVRREAGVRETYARMFLQPVRITASQVVQRRFAPR